jgi:hypothetical protein
MMIKRFHGKAMPGWLFFFLLPLLTTAQQKKVTIRIVQDEPFVLDKYDSHITLQKKPFKIQVLLENIAGVYAFASFTDSLCCRVSELDSITGFAELPERTMKDVDYNKEKELLVNDDNSCAYWFYDRELTYKGFNKKVYELDSSRVVAVKSIKQIFYVPDQKEIKLKDLNSPLYLFFLAVSDFDANGHPIKELMRRKLKIDWIPEVD